MPRTSPEIVLASGSPYRRQLLARLLPEFSVRSPDIDESPRPGEAADALALRLAGAKAAAIAAPGRLVIGSDQVAALGTELLGKPGTLPRALAQLRAMAGKAVVFHTGLCVTDGTTSRTALDRTVVRFRPFDEATAARYLAREPALDCAGSFMAEGLGISLCEAIECDDPTALIGLPLVGLARLLREFGVSIP